MIHSDGAKKYMRVYIALKADILENRLPPDAPLVEVELCERFGISRTPVRQALQELERDGLLEYVPNKGMFVSQLKIVDALEIYRIREALDPLAVEISYLDSPQHLLSALETSLEQQNQHIQAGDYHNYLRADMEFHQAYTRNCTNRRLGAFLSHLVNDSLRFSNYAYGDVERAKISITQHQEIVDALRQGDLMAAKEAVRSHMELVREYFKAKL